MAVMQWWKASRRILLDKSKLSDPHKDLPVQRETLLLPVNCPKCGSYEMKWQLKKHPQENEIVGSFHCQNCSYDAVYVSQQLTEQVLNGELFVHMMWMPACAQEAKDVENRIAENCEPPETGCSVSG